MYVCIRTSEVQAKKTETNPSSNIGSSPTTLTTQTNSILTTITTTMEPQTPPPPSPPDQKPAAMANYNRYSSTVDTSSPFSSVKEAVAIFGEKFLVAEIYSSPSPKPFSPSININPKEEYSSPPWKFTPSPMKKSSTTTTDEQTTLVEETLKRLESELQETKTELKLLKERGAETEIQLASLNAELHKNMSKLAQAEAAEAAAEAKAKAKARTTNSASNSLRDHMVVRMEDSAATLDQILSIGEEEGLFGGIKKEERKMTRKKKPIVPLVTDLLFSWKKGSSSAAAADHLHGSLFPSTHHVYLN